MIKLDDVTWRYSATDLLTWQACHHASAKDAAAQSHGELRQWLKDQRDVVDGAGVDGLDDPAARRGDEHEAAVLEEWRDRGRSIVEIVRPAAASSCALQAAAQMTRQAMHDGVDVIYQAALLDQPWFGFADFLVRVDGVPSALGDHAYEVLDTKLARHATAGALLQTAHYGAMVEAIQGAAPPRLVLVLGNGEQFSWPYGSAVPYLHELRRRFLAFHASTPPTAPLPVQRCSSCRWSVACEGHWGPDDLKHVHRLTGRQRLALRASGLSTIPLLAAAPSTARPRSVSLQTFDRLQQQARAQVGDDEFVVITPQPAATGLPGTPAPHEHDLYFDLEGDPFAAIPTREYLWAYCDSDGKYEHRWAHSEEGEREAFCWFIDELRRREGLGGDWRVYHYNSYEVTALRRMAENWPDATQAEELVRDVDRLIEERFDDLYRRVETGLRTRGGTTSLKLVEKLAGYDRSADVASVSRADDSIRAYETYLRTDDATAAAELLEGIRRYNEHDVLATRAVHAWLHGLGTAVAVDDLLKEDATEVYVPSDDVLSRARHTASLRKLLHLAADAADLVAGALPSGLTPDGGRLLSEMLEWHVRESGVQYLDFLRLSRWVEDGGENPAPDADLPPVWQELNSADPVASSIRAGTEHESCLLDVYGPVTVHPPKSPRANAVRRREYRCRPGAWKVKAGTELVEVPPPGADRKPLSIRVDHHDPVNGTFSFSRGDVPPDLGSLVIKPFHDTGTVWEALMALGDDALRTEPRACALTSLALLGRVPPLAKGEMATRPGEPADQRALRLVARMAGGVLPVQGPPGTGKTHLGAALIRGELDRAAAAGRSVVIGVTANSHHVIDNLLAEVVDPASGSQVAHVGSADQVATERGILALSGSKSLRPWLDAQRAAGSRVVVGATKFAWARDDLAGMADLMLVDEAGQVALADAAGFGLAARRMVALGDPQQLAAPVQAAHDESVRVSLLEHLAQGSAVLPSAVGVFLDRSHRMHPDVCRVVSTLAYDSTLTSTSTAAARSITGPVLRVAGMHVPVRAGVHWLPVAGGEGAQAQACAALTAALVAGTASGAVVTDEHGVDTALDASQVLVVAPHNAHVNRIATQVPAGVRVGTVDRFQGKQAHVVVYSLGRLAEAGRDVPFLYEVNRLNVALSRARLMAVVVADPDARFPPVTEPEHLRLASAFLTVLG